MAPTLRWEKDYAKKVVLCNDVKLMLHPPVKRLVFPTVPLQFTKDQCKALSEGKTGSNVTSKYMYLHIVTSGFKRALSQKSFSKFVYKLTRNPMNGVCQRDQLT